MFSKITCFCIGIGMPACSLSMRLFKISPHEGKVVLNILWLPGRSELDSRWTGFADPGISRYRQIKASEAAKLGLFTCTSYSSLPCTCCTVFSRATQTAEGFVDDST